MDPEIKDLIDDEIVNDELDGDDQLDDGDESGGEAPVIETPPVKSGKPVKADPPAPPAPPVKQQPNHVPLATFLQEKNKFTTALDEQRARADKLERELEALRNPPKAAPKFADDPEGFIAHATKANAQDLLAKLDEHGKRIGEVADATKQTAEQRAETEFLDNLDRTGTAFAQTHEDYGQALAHVRQIAYRQLKVYHPEASDDQLMEAISKQEIGLARQALQMGRNPHEVAYALAEANGYAKKAAAPVPPKKGGKVAKPVVPDDDGEEVLDPDLTLGRSNGEAPDSDDDDIPDPNTVDPFDDALKEVFGRRQRRA